MPAIKTTVIPPTINQSGIRMWPFSEMSLPAATLVGTIANWVLLGSLLGGVLSTFVIVKTADVKEEHWAEDRTKSNERIAELNNETERLKASNIALAGIMEPRRLSMAGTTGGSKHNAEEVARLNDELKQYADVEAWIVAVSDFEAQSLASDIAALLGIHSKWRVKVVGKDVSLRVRGFLGGVTINSRGGIKFDGEANTFKVEMTETVKRALAAANILNERLQLELGTNFFSVHVEHNLDSEFSPTNFPKEGEAWKEPVPENALLITIGVKPLSSLLYEHTSGATPPHK